MRKMAVFIKPYKFSVILVILFVFLQSLSELFLPTLMSDIIDKGVVNGDIPYIWKIGGVMVLVAALGMACAIFASYHASKTAAGFGRDVREKLFTHVENFSQKEIDQLGTASLITRTTNDVTQVQNVLINFLRILVRAPLMAIGGIIMALTQDVKLSLIFLFTLPILAGTIFFIARKGIPLFKEIQKKIDRLNKIVREKLIGVRVIRAFNKEEREERRFDEANADLTKTTLKVNIIMASMMPAMMLILNLSTVAIVWFGAVRIDQGNMAVGDLMAFIQYAMQIMFSLIMVSMVFIMIPRAQVSIDRINEVLDTKPSIKSGNNKNNKKTEFNEKGYIEFQNVSFHYPGAEKPALSNISFSAGPGEVTAIIGGTGSGKSSLIHLIPRFYDVTDGSIKVDGKDIREFPLDQLREKIGFVPQKSVLFSGSIADNIRYGKEDATDEEVKRAAETAQALEFIDHMKNGFDTVISQGGTNISGGQKQRISIARALVRKPEIYLFDDSFSALDFKTDARLREALKMETVNSTVIIVAQRVSTVMDADRIIVLNEGKIVGIGTHKQLLKSCSVYKEIVSSQFSKEEIA
ncbi:ABC transporter ATP-binding protein [Fervidibacillus halotolerans]|uniref:ABC transporter ATP-binding protein/permease n=1 Tax=Fervidibacillus halotolerans TaxID=2980027 RepID=A0A9E8LXN4_9BACI|nr:ABC transporter ATP-binding protein [Fervidibacillus halotolerans]WAA11638.1 ABC transporter ATP-binding protein/permease [Fervidibacillus halotolerans]